ncbi:hypothetical protein AB0B15_11730 [Streptomyces sp. NPDC045456]|uniref:hypothetical protein n=1 Tax=Streptomyces sp. NPDC045456 TaxID=3155254 RepID=UPI0033D8E6C5
MAKQPSPTRTPEQPAHLAHRETDGIIMQAVKNAYLSHIPDEQQHSAAAHEWQLPADFIPDLPFTAAGHPDALRSIDLWQQAMQAYTAPSQDRPSRDAPALDRAPQDWLNQANQCGESWQKKGCPLSPEGLVPKPVIEQLAADVRIPPQLLLPQVLFGWLLAWLVFEPDTPAARQGFYSDLASSTDYGKYARGELEDLHALAIAEIRTAQRGLSLTAAVRHILMAKKCVIMARHRSRCITNYPEPGVPVLVEAASRYRSTNAMICEWYALDMGLPTLADRALASDADRAYFGIAKMVNDVHDLAIDTYTGDVGNGVRLYGDGTHGTNTLVAWLVGLGHLAPALAAKIESSSLSSQDRKFLAGCAPVTYNLWGHRSEVWPVVGQMTQKGYGWGALSEGQCAACRTAPRCGTCFYRDTRNCTHLHPAPLTGTSTDAAEIVNTALDITGAADLINPAATARAITRLTTSSPTALGWHALRKQVDPQTAVTAALTQGIYALTAECAEAELTTLTDLARAAWWHVLPGFFKQPAGLALDTYMYSTAAHPHITLTFGSHVAGVTP